MRYIVYIATHILIDNMAWWLDFMITGLIQRAVEFQLLDSSRLGMVANRFGLVAYTLYQTSQYFVLIMS